MPGHSKTPRVRLYLCECGPLIKDSLDLDQLSRRFADRPEVSEVLRYSTLCSEEGKDWMTRDLSAHPECRVVVAGCTPKEHEETFRTICRGAGVNPYLMTVANIREQCAWVTEDPAASVDKAEGIIQAAVARALSLEPLEERAVPSNPDALVIGAGMAGLTAAGLLADGGRKVYLVERTGALGGRTALLGDVFPGFECASCMLQPVIDEVLHHPNVEVLTTSELGELVGYVGNFTARIRRRSRHVDPEACYGCGSCRAVCPVEAPDEANERIVSRAAVHLPYEGALPNVSMVDEASCTRFAEGDGCDLCAAACPFGAIDLDGAEEILERSVGAVIVATGAFQEQADTMAEDCPPRIIGAMALERLINSAGPTDGQLALPGGEPPRSVALIHCSDSAGFAPVDTCSKICCMGFAKYAHQIHEKLPDCVIHELAWERCAGGKGFKAFADSAERIEGLNMIRMAPEDRVEGVMEMEDVAVVSYRRGGEARELEVDLVVVSPPLSGARGVRELAKTLRLEVDREGFLEVAHERLLPFKTRVEGILVAGSAQGPGDIQDAAARGAAAAGAVLSFLAPGRMLQVEPAVSSVDPERCSRCGTCLRTCPYSAISRTPEGRPEVNDLLCKGCGTCAAACPSGAIDAKHFTADQIMAEVTAQLAMDGDNVQNAASYNQNEKE